MLTEVCVYLRYVEIVVWLLKLRVHWGPRHRSRVNHRYTKIVVQLLRSWLHGGSRRRLRHLERFSNNQPFFLQWFTMLSGRSGRSGE